MFSLDQKKMGYLLIAFSIILLVILTLVKADIDARDVFLCESVHSDPDTSMAQCPAHTSNTSWLLIIAFGIGFLVFGSGLYMVFAPFPKGREISEESSGFKAIDPAKLEKGERQLYDALMESEGSMYQSDLIRTTGLSKVQITRILDRMEHKGIIERKRRGMTNIVVLK